MGGNEEVLNSLRQDFDRRLEVIRAADFGDRASLAMDEPIRTKGQYRVEDSY